ncbi:M14 family zinc carboxypeptidase [Rudaea sp.]|uniref:M14 family zinc carboxypeptidase n=1 Tax=Rudaea sp. TaxID=2136325 RepID=UPI00321F8F85
MSIRSAFFTAVVAGIATTRAQAGIYDRDPQQAVDKAYTDKITQYTTAAQFNSPLTNYLPASNTVPTPAKVLGDVSGAPNMLPYTKDVVRYFDLLAQTSPRVKVFRIGRSEEGREMIAVAVADEALLANLKDNDARLAQLADPRTLVDRDGGLDDVRADALMAQTTPVYYITGAIHSPETGSPTALMELAYRLAVDDAPYIKKIRSRVITLITPVVETDGRDRMVDLYNWHRANPGKTPPPLMYWGHYVAHDNNRDAMGLTLALSRNVLDTYLGWHAQVLHDLHESVPFLYDNTVGDGPYNAWVDPILVGEWQQLGWSNVQELTRFGMPGAFTHGDFDTWSPGYLMFMAAMHNGISRLYETFGNSGADTVERILDPSEYARTWYRPNPPLPKVLWSQRNNNNYQQSALLSTLNYFADNEKAFLRNFYLKSKRSIEKPQAAGPAAYVLAADDVHRDAQRQLLRVLQLQHVEVSRATAPITAQVPAPPKEDGKDEAKKDGKPAKTEKPKTVARTFPAGSYVVRMDQPYSRIADTLLDRQYWSPDDPQKHPYDDTAWALGDMFGAEVVRVTDAATLKAPMETLREAIPARGGVQGSGSIYLIENHADTSLMTLRYAFKGADIAVAEKPFEAAGRHFGAGTWIVRKTDGAALSRKLAELDLDAWAVASEPNVASHKISAPRLALMHTWLSTQTEGWWRQAFDKLGIPYDYISTQTVARNDVRAKYDVILFAPIGADNSQLVLNGLPLWGNAQPWKKTALTPNMGIDETDDIRPGLGASGLAHLQRFVEQGGLLLAAGDAARFAIDVGLAPGVSVTEKKDLKVVGSILQGVTVDEAHPVAYGYAKEFAMYSPDGLSFKLSNLLTGDDGLPTAKDFKRPTGRGGPHDTDTPEGRIAVDAAELPAPKPWEATPLNIDQARPGPFFPSTVIPEDQRARAVVRFGEADDLLIAGLLQGGASLAERAAVVDARYGRGHVVLFATNPIWRGQTIATYGLVFNAILNYDKL